MGDPRKIRSKVKTPIHPWQKARIEEEKGIVREYGIPRKRELWRMNTILSDVKTQIKRLAERKGPQAETEKELLTKRLIKIGLIKEGITLQSVLSLTSRDMLERRLQTKVAKVGLARSVKQARQFILHGHISVDGQKITSPSYIVPAEDETKITFAQNSSLTDPAHPERINKEKPAAPIKKEYKPKEKFGRRRPRPQGNK